MNLQVNYEGKVEDMTSEDVQKVEKFIDDAEYLALGTVDRDWGVHLSVLTKLDSNGLEELYFTSPLNTRKMKNLKEHPQCEIMFSMDKKADSEGRGGQVNIYGEIQILTGLEIKEEKWEEYMKKYFPDGPQDENMAILKFNAKHINAMLM